MRRLRLLLELVRGTQAAHKLAPAEVERAHKLAGDLRAERAQLLGEASLRALEKRFSTLLTLEPTLAERLSTYRQETDALLGESLTAFHGELETAHEALPQRASERVSRARAGAARPRADAAADAFAHNAGNHPAARRRRAAPPRAAPQGRYRDPARPG